MIDAILANSWATTWDLYRNKKINTIDASVIKNIYRMLEEVGLGAYRPTNLPFISEDNKIEFYNKK
jgi:hypothetical protein